MNDGDVTVYQIDGGGVYCECHIVRPTSYGFPIVRPDAFCGQHVNDLGMFRTFAALIPEPAALPLPVNLQDTNKEHTNA